MPQDAKEEPPNPTLKRYAGRKCHIVSWLRQFAEFVGSPAPYHFPGDRRGCGEASAT